MSISFEKTEDLSARSASGLERSVVPDTTLQTELEQSVDPATQTDLTQISGSTAGAIAEHSLTDQRSDSLQPNLPKVPTTEPIAVSEKAPEAPVADSSAEKNAVEGVKPQADHEAGQGEAGSELQPGADAAHNFGHQFEALLNAPAIVSEGAEQVWSDLFLNVDAADGPVQQIGEAGVDSVGDGVSRSMLEQSLATFDHFVFALDKQGAASPSFDQKTFDLSDAVSPYERVFLGIKSDALERVAAASSHSAEATNVDHPVDLQRVVEGVPASEQGSPPADTATPDATIPASGAYFVDVTFAVRPGLTSHELLQALHAGQEHHG